MLKIEIPESMYASGDVSARVRFQKEA